jgi:hypothetical protein
VGGESSRPVGCLRQEITRKLKQRAHFPTCRLELKRALSLYKHHQDSAMGCKQSKIEEQVEAPVAVAETETETAAAVEAAPATEVPPASSTPAVEEAKPETEAPAAEVAAEAPAPTEAAPTSSTVSEVTSTEAVASETKQEVSDVAEVAVAPASVAAAEETVAEPAAETAAEPAAETSAEPTAETAAEPAAETAAEPEIETTPAAEEESAPEPTVSFVAAGATTEQNVVFYQFTVVNKEDPAKETTIRKRFNDFKVLHAEVAKLMASATNVPASQGAKFATYPALPPLPKSGMTTVLLGRKNKNLTADREAQFTNILNAIARHPVAFESDAVKSFLA